MTAVSVALRFRNRNSQEFVQTLDSVAEDAETSRLLFDSSVVVDNVIATHRVLKAGDRLQTFTDDELFYNSENEVSFDSLIVSDNKVVRKENVRRVLDSTTAKDDGFITDKDLSRYRLSSDVIEDIQDFFQKAVIRDNVVFSRVLTSTIRIFDSVRVEFAGIYQRTLVDVVPLVEFLSKDHEKLKVDNISLLDSVTITRANNAKDLSIVSISEDVIVSRSALLNEKITLDSFNVSDLTVGTFVPKQIGVSAKIKHGIEMF